MARAVEQHLIGVTITFGIHGVPIYQFSSLFGTESKPENFSVGTGDQVAWRVVVIDSNQRISSPAFNLAFTNASVFGTSSLAVAGGGVSPFLQALAMSGSTKYTLTVAGINPPDDPVIQIDNTGVNLARVKAPGHKAASYQVYWDDTAGGSPTWQAAGGLPQQFPMAQALHSGDIVTFAAAAAANSFTIVFDVPPPEPLFSGESADFFTIPSTLAGPSTGPQTVLNFLAGKTFGFIFQDAAGNMSAHATFSVSG